MKRLLVLALVAGCGDPVFVLKFRLTRGESQQCIADNGTVATSCSQITLLCDAYVNIRVYKPSDPTAPLISMCKPAQDSKSSLCGISTPDFDVPMEKIPAQTLAVEMSVFPASAITFNPETKSPICPRVTYNDMGLAIPQPCVDGQVGCVQVPAVGGLTYYHPGDDETIVELGCADLGELTDPAVCGTGNRVEVTASVNDFDNLVSSVDKNLADALDVSIGEPSPVGNLYKLNDDVPLERTTAATPSWAATFPNLDIGGSACIAVREDGALTTTSLRCYPAAMKHMLDLEGAYLSRSTLADILMSAGKATFPDEGLTIGMVIDDNFEPKTGQAVTCDPPGCTIQSLDATHPGVFISTDAAYGTVFSIESPDSSANSAIGGLVEGKVTVVVLQYKELKPN